MSRLFAALSVAIVAGCASASTAEAAEPWKFSGRQESDGKAFCQGMSDHGLGLRFYLDRNYIIAFIDVDAATNPALQKVIQNKSEAQQIARAIARLPELWHGAASPQSPPASAEK